jgi:hypothetical protein
MHSSAWVALLRHIPAEQQNELMLVTAGGVEITIQTLLRVERDFVAFKGRLSGTQDAGRVLFVPYVRIDYFGFQQELKESEFHERFSGLTIPEVEPQPAAPVAPSQELPEPEPEALPEPGAAAPAAGRTPIKSAVLERFRSRSSSVGPRTPAE